MRALLYWLSGRLPCRIICDGDRPYLERYYLWTIFGTRWYLHRFVASDPDRGYHDHPWPWAIAFLLLGWYWDMRRSGARRVRWVNTLTGDSFHRVVLPLDRGVESVWTVFVHRARDVKPWGFLRDKGQIGVVYTPFSYPQGVKQSEWWKKAPRGRDESRRMPR
jgi:hypothetical protein